MTEATQLNLLLAGSPYSFEDSAADDLRAREVLDQMLKIQRRQEDVGTQLAAQAAAIKEEVERDFDVRFVYESNAIEGVKTSLAETQQLLASNPLAPDFIQAYTFGRHAAK
ncbi:MAG: hypothetical protein ACR2G7_00025 [Acidimicrobiales bacterium]